MKIPGLQKAAVDQANCSVTTVQWRTPTGQGCMIDTSHEAGNAARRSRTRGSPLAETSPEIRVRAAPLQKGRYASGTGIPKGQGGFPVWFIGPGAGLTGRKSRVN